MTEYLYAVTMPDGKIFDSPSTDSLGTRLSYIYDNYEDALAKADRERYFDAKVTKYVRVEE